MAKKPSASDFDPGVDGEASASPDTLVQLRASIKDMIDLEGVIEVLEGDLKAAKQSLQSLRTGRLPDLMAEIQSDHFTHDGWDVKLSDFVSGSLPKDPEKREAAIKWLEAHDASGLIKTELKVMFGRSEYKEAMAQADELITDGHAVDVSSGVHTQTLHQFARERIRGGDEIDFEVLGLYTGKVVKAKKVK